MSDPTTASVSSPPVPSMGKKLAAEAVGTFVLVFGGCGTAVLAAKAPAGDESNPLGVGFLGVALAFGLTVLVMAFAVGHISGGHFNPAVSVGAASGGRLPWKDVPPYVVAQVVGAIVASALLYVIASGAEGFNAVEGGFATNGFGEKSPGGYGLVSALLIEIVLTAVFLWVILGATDHRAPAGFAPVAIGLSLTLIHLISIPVTNTSVNPARSIGPALFAGAVPLSQLWLFIVAPLVGALIAGFTYGPLFGEKRTVSEKQAARTA